MEERRSENFIRLPVAVDLISLSREEHEAKGLSQARLVGAESRDAVDSEDSIQESDQLSGGVMDGAVGRKTLPSLQEVDNRGTAGLVGLDGFPDGRGHRGVRVFSEVLVERSLISFERNHPADGPVGIDPVERLEVRVKLEKL